MTATMTRSPSGAFVIEGGTDAEGYELLIDVIGEFARRGYTNWTVEPTPKTPVSPAGLEPRRDGARPFRAHPEECTARSGDNVPAVEASKGPECRCCGMFHGPDWTNRGHCDCCRGHGQAVSR